MFGKEEDMNDLLLKNGTIITLEDECAIANWVTAKDGKIVAMGTGEPAAEASEVIDLEEATVLPGLFDAHCHVMTTGQFLAGVNLLDVKCLQDVFDLIDEAAAKADEGAWVFAGGFMSQAIKEERFPDRKELDAVSHGHPVMMCSQTLHGVTLNTKALEYVDVPDVAGVGKYEDGSLNGVLLSDDSALAVQAQVCSLQPESVLEDFIVKCTEYAAEQGVTTLCGLMGQFVEGDIDVDIAMKKEFPVDIEIFYQTWDLDKVKAKGLPRIGGCLTLDGAGFEYTMANMHCYPERPERRGFLIHADEEIYQLISAAHRDGIQTALHALGERAIDQLLFIYRQVFGEQGRGDLRHRVEHFSLPSDLHMDMLAEMKLVASMQPAFAQLWGPPEGGFYESMLNRHYADRMEVFPEILKRGGIICGGSDSPVTLINPLFGIASCIRNVDPRRNIPVTEAIKVFTYNAAYSVNKEDVKGSIKPGKCADFTVIDRNLYDYADSDEIYDIKVLRTIRDGKTTYKR